MDWSPTAASSRTGSSAGPAAVGADTGRRVSAPRPRGWSGRRTGWGSAGGFSAAEPARPARAHHARPRSETARGIERRSLDVAVQIDASADRATAGHEVNGTSATAGSSGTAHPPTHYEATDVRRSALYQHRSRASRRSARSGRWRNSGLMPRAMPHGCRTVYSLSTRIERSANEADAARGTGSRDGGQTSAMLDGADRGEPTLDTLPRPLSQSGASRPVGTTAPAPRHHCACQPQMQVARVGTTPSRRSCHEPHRQRPLVRARSGGTRESVTDYRQRPTTKLAGHEGHRIVLGAYSG
ncbi:hypothetical protein SAMN05216377_110119 [Pseudonocardia oroxyli]|uniref:Uncharacterized protein n=1 Tax=Pseudonocardia oroxyli TaxID=366584 RepID=A0A1G7SWJ8_PSEOR|nr:hypothetical protein SAMN05216377_110119 [Pseudonocardia oroxyli]